jgi:hypothetical protein
VAILQRIPKSSASRCLEVLVAEYTMIRDLKIDKEEEINASTCPVITMWNMESSTDLGENR